MHAGVAEVPDPVGAVRLRLVATPHGRRRARRRTPTCAAPSLCDLRRRGATRARSSAGSAPTRCAPTPTPTSPGDGSAQPPHDRRPADGPDGAGRRRQRLPRRGALPAPHPPAPPRQHPPGRSVARDVGRPGRADGRGRADRADRHRPPRAHPRGDGPAAAHGRPRGRGLRLPPHVDAVPACAARPCAPPSWSGRNLFWCPRCQPTFRSRAVQSAARTLGRREELDHEFSPRAPTDRWRGRAARAPAQPDRPARVADPGAPGRRHRRHRRGHLGVPRLRAAGEPAGPAGARQPACSARGSCRGSWCSCCWCWP